MLKSISTEECKELMKDSVNVLPESKKSFKELLMLFKLSDDVNGVYYENRRDITRLPLSEIHELKKLLPDCINDTIVNEHQYNARLDYYSYEPCIESIHFDLNLEYSLSGSGAYSTGVKPRIGTVLTVYGDAGCGPKLLSKAYDGHFISDSIKYELFHKLKFDTITEDDKNFLFDEITKSVREQFKGLEFVYGKFTSNEKQ